MKQICSFSDSKRTLHHTTLHLGISINEQNQAVIVHTEVTSSHKFALVFIPHSQQSLFSCAMCIFLQQLGDAITNCMDRRTRFCCSLLELPARARLGLLHIRHNQ